MCYQYLPYQSRHRPARCKDMDISTLEEEHRPREWLADTSAFSAHRAPYDGFSCCPADPAVCSVCTRLQETGLPGPQPEVREDADRIILQNTVFSEDNYGTIGIVLLRKNSGNENNLVHTWQQAAERESRQRLRRFLLISVALLGLLGGIVGEQLGLWSLRAVVDRAVEMVRQRVALISGTVVPPEAGGLTVTQGPRRCLPSPDASGEREGEC